MKRPLLLLLMCWAGCITHADAQRSPQQIADSAIRLVGHRDEVHVKEQLRGNVKSVEMSISLANEADYIVQQVLLDELGCSNPPDDSPSTYLNTGFPLLKAQYSLQGELTAAQVYYNGHIIDTVEIPAWSLMKNFRTHSFGDTLILESVDAEKYPWLVVTILKSSRVLDIRTKAESDVIFYEDYIFTYPNHYRCLVSQYTQKLVHDADYNTIKVPDTPGITLRNKYNASGPDSHALRQQALSGIVELIQTDSGILRNYYTAEDTGHPQSFALINDHGLITDGTFKFYSTVRMLRKYTYDAAGNWIKMELSFPEEPEMSDASPVIRKIEYY